MLVHNLFLIKIKLLEIKQILETPNIKKKELLKKIYSVLMSFH